MCQVMLLLERAENILQKLGGVTAKRTKKDSRILKKCCTCFSVAFWIGRQNTPVFVFTCWKGAQLLDYLLTVLTPVYRLGGGLHYATCVNCETTLT